MSCSYVCVYSLLSVLQAQSDWFPGFVSHRVTRDHLFVDHATVIKLRLHFDTSPGGAFQPTSDASAIVERLSAPTQSPSHTPAHSHPMQTEKTAAAERDQRNVHMRGVSKQSPPLYASCPQVMCSPICCKWPCMCAADLARAVASRLLAAWCALCSACACDNV